MVGTVISFYDDCIWSYVVFEALLTALSLFTPLKRETEKAPLAVSSPIAIGCFHFVRSVAKNVKLAMLKQSHFLNATPLSTFNSANARERA